MPGGSSASIAASPSTRSGQRSGFGIGGRAGGAAAAPWYVADKDMARNALIVVQDPDHPLLLSDAFDVEQLHWYSRHDAAQRSNARSRRATGRAICLPCCGPCRERAPTGRRVSLSEPRAPSRPASTPCSIEATCCLGGGVIAQRFNSRSARPPPGGITYNSVFSAEGS